MATGGEIGMEGSGMVVQFGRSEQEWAQLVEVGRKFLVERALMRRTTSYTEFNAALVNVPIPRASTSTSMVTGRQSANSSGGSPRTPTLKPVGC